MIKINNIPVRNTKQRQAILDIVSNSYDHPTTDMIYSRVIKQMPNISMGTVYRNLAQLVASKQINQITMPSGADRYDRNISTHFHFVCNECNEICDIDNMEITQQLYEDRCLNGYILESVNLVVYGKCPKCKNK